MGIRDQSKSERLQMDADFTLEKAKTLVQQREAVHEQQVLLKTGQKRGQINCFPTTETAFRGKAPQKNCSQAPVRKPEEKQSKCSRCDRGPHSQQQCPARDAECHHCKKKGHYSAQCFKKSIADVTTFLGHVIDEHGASPDPSKTKAVAEMETPKSFSELRRFMGMTNQLGKFTPDHRESFSVLAREK